MAAPRVAHPLDASKFLAAACSSLTAADLSTLNLTGATSESHITAKSPVCNWDAFNATDAAKNYHVGVTWETIDTNGLSAIYSLKSEMAYWQPTQIGGYPAVIAGQLDQRLDGDCVVDVGVSDSLFFFVGYQTSDSSVVPQSCALATRAAADVIKNLKGGA
jgi:hypothetical protein